jgi:hypothetical protein
VRRGGATFTGELGVEVVIGDTEVDDFVDGFEVEGTDGFEDEGTKSEGERPLDGLTGPMGEFEEGSEIDTTGALL